MTKNWSMTAFAQPWPTSICSELESAYEREVAFGANAESGVINIVTVSTQLYIFFILSICTWSRLLALINKCFQSPKEGE